MVRRLVIPIDIPAGAALPGSHAAGWLVTEAVTGEGVPMHDAPVGADQAAEPAVEPDAFSAAVVHSKVRSPAIRPATLERPRLLNWLERHATARLRVIMAEAGYGKSTLLADHARRTTRPTIWFRLEPSDRDWVTFLSYVVASVRELKPGFGTRTVGLLQQVGVLNATRDVTLDTLLAELESVAIEPLTLILDDFHTVQDSDDVRAIVLRLLEHAPAGLALVIAGRDRPSIPLARLAAQSRVAELTTEDLRFTRRETADLFAHSYGTPIDEDLVAVIDERLEGWGASLQLVCASLLSLRPEEVRAFVRDLSAHSGPLYDFLAEEVLSRQTPVMRRVLTHGALLQRISPHLLAAATADPRPVLTRQITVCLYRAEDAGLISRTAAGSGRWRFHPLVHEFLRVRLRSALTPDQLSAMHLRVAIAAEPGDWLASIHHYLEAGRPEDGMRVLREAAVQALGTASWGEAIELVTRTGDHPLVPAAAVIQARALVAEGQPDAAIALLDHSDMSGATGLERSLVGMTRAAALYMQSRSAELLEVLQAVFEEESTPPNIRMIVDTWIALVSSPVDSPLLPVARALRNLAAQHKSEGLAYFAGISLNNAMCVELARGAYEDAITLGRDALDQFSYLSVRTPELASLHSTLALALAESGEVEKALDQVDVALSVSKPQPDALAECAWLAAVTGRASTAWSCIQQAERIHAESFHQLGADLLLVHAKVLLAVGRGDTAQAAAVLSAVNSPRSELSGDHVRRMMLEALVATAGHLPHAIGIAEAGLDLARRQGTWRWEPRLRLLLAAASSNGEEFGLLLRDVADSGPMALLEIADVIADHLDLLAADSEPLIDSIAAFPARWLPPLRRCLSTGPTPKAHVAARLLAAFGTREDLVRLSAWEQTYTRHGKQRTLAAALSRRVTPALFLRDLGRTEFAIGDSTVHLSQVRRKAAALLLLLGSKTGQAAGRELLLDELWPDASPSDALNSLHQTMYYLRRCIDEWYDDATSADYVVLESELIYLEPAFVVVESVHFQQQAALAIGAPDPRPLGVPTLLGYRGTFAPEFEYEEWAIDYRGRVHAQYLRLVHAVADAQIVDGAYGQAATVLASALQNDPTAFELEAQLVKALWLGGSRAAALEHFRHYAHAHQRELGLAAPTLHDLMS